ncbi:MAG: hypothetical protein ACLU9S_24555 [Oscillospiraceae bacterium]
MTLRYTGPFFHEFLLDMPKSEAVLAALEQAGILGGLPVDSGILWCATEKASKEALDQTIAIVKGGAGPMKLIFEKSVSGRRCSMLPACDVETVELPEGFARTEAPALPEMSETDISRHYSELCRQVHGVNCGFYPLGSCTMKYNPRDW